jgi:hypothetical protein
MSVQFLFKLANTKRCYVDQENYFAGKSLGTCTGQAQMLRSCEHGDQEYSDTSANEDNSFRNHIR